MSRYLEMVDSPMHVKKLTLEQLQQLAEEIRHELITVLSPENYFLTLTQEALTRAGIKVEDIGMLVGGSSSPDNVTPAEAAAIAMRMAEKAGWYRIVPSRRPV